MPAAHPAVPTFGPPVDWSLVDAAVAEHGVAIVQNVFPTAVVDDINESIDAWLADHSDAGRPATAVEGQNAFLGHATIRLKSIFSKFGWAGDAITHPDLLAWARRELEPRATSVQVTTAEVIEVGPGQERQPLHRDGAAWPVPRAAEPILANAIVALTEFTVANGATNVVPGSHRWPDGQRLHREQVTQAVMQPGDAVLIHGDTLHGAGSNVTDAVRRRGLSITYMVGWLRPVENLCLSVPPELARELSPEAQDLIGYDVYDGTSRGGVLLGLYDGVDPRPELLGRSV